MNKKEQFNKLRWKYFWQQKVNEICKIIVIIELIVGFAYFIGQSWIPIIMEANGMGNSQQLNFLTIVLLVFLFFTIFGTLIFGIYLLMEFIKYIIKQIKRWLCMNMKKAEERAHNELKSKGGIKRKDGIRK